MAVFSITNAPAKADQTMSIRVIALLVTVIASLAAAHGSVPIIVSSGVGRRIAMSFSKKANDQLENGDVAGASVT